MKHIPLSLHLFIHFFLAVLVGYFIGLELGFMFWSVTAAILGGFFIDLDHVLEYFLVFPWHFNLKSFFADRQFVQSGKIHIFFHAWEHIPLLFILIYLFRDYKILSVSIFSLTIGGIVHLISDCYINNFPIKNYSLFYRYRHHFSAQELLKPEQYQKHLLKKQNLSK